MSKIPFDYRCGQWSTETFGEEVAHDKIQRGHRLFEEVTELLQALDVPKEDLLTLIDYTYAKPKGQLVQEVGGVMTTLGTLCFAIGVNMVEAGELELQRVWYLRDVIRAKWEKKVKGSPLPSSPTVLERQRMQTALESIANEEPMSVINDRRPTEYVNCSVCEHMISTAAAALKPQETTNDPATKDPA